MLVAFVNSCCLILIHLRQHFWNCLQLAQKYRESLLQGNHVRHFQSQMIPGFQLWLCGVNPHKTLLILCLPLFSARLYLSRGPVGGGGGGGARVPCLNFTSSYVNISQGSHVASRNSSKRNCDIGVAFPISLE